MITRTRAAAPPTDLHRSTAAARRRTRERIVDLCAGPTGGHLGGSMSLVEILSALYEGVLDVRPDEPDWVDRDLLVLSKGHGALGLYATLAEVGFIDDADLDGYGTTESTLLAHPHPHVPGIEHATGSLGHGLAVGLGLALGAKLAGRDSRCFVVLGDGELQEGSVWEAASVAASLGLDNLVAVVDRNRLQITGPTEDVHGLEPLGDRWRAFGWDVREVDGHDVDALVPVLAAPTVGPGLVLARTVKGKGVGFLEDDVRSHFAKLSERQARRAKALLRRELQEGAA